MTEKYNGTERRQSLLNNEEKEILRNISKSVNGKRFFGFKIQELVILGSVLLGISAFYLRTNDTLDRLVNLSEYTQKFMKNSDGYHSAILGLEFDKGRPINGKDYISKVRSIARLENLNDAV